MTDTQPDVAPHPAERLEELHRSIPDYRLADGHQPHFSTGIRQADPLLLELDPA